MCSRAKCTIFPFEMKWSIVSSASTRKFKYPSTNIAKLCLKIVNILVPTLMISYLYANHVDYVILN